MMRNSPIHDVLTQSLCQKRKKKRKKNRCDKSERMFTIQQLWLLRLCLLLFNRLISDLNCCPMSNICMYAVVHVHFFLLFFFTNYRFSLCFLLPVDCCYCSVTLFSLGFLFNRFDMTMLCAQTTENNHIIFN